jgi:hypothetical protein
LTLDDDVAAVLDRLRRNIRASLKDFVNEGLRRGLKDMVGRPKMHTPVGTKVVSLGRLRIAGIDSVDEALAIAEGEPFK